MVKDDRSLKEKLAEVAESQKRDFQEREDEAIMARIRALPTWQEMLEEKLHPDIEGSLRERMHLRPRITATRVPDESNLETELRERMHLRRRNL